MTTLDTYMVIYLFVTRDVLNNLEDIVSIVRG